MRPVAIDGEATSAGRCAATALNVNISFQLAFSLIPAGLGFACAQPSSVPLAFGRLA
jgi:hypothetical protein